MHASHAALADAFLAATAVEVEDGVIPDYAARPLFPWEQGRIDFMSINDLHDIAYAATAGSIERVQQAIAKAVENAMAEGDTPEQIIQALQNFALNQPKEVREVIKEETRVISRVLADAALGSGRLVAASAEAQGVEVPAEVRTLGALQAVTGVPEDYVGQAGMAMVGAWNRVNQALMLATGGLVGAAAIGAGTVAADIVRTVNPLRIAEDVGKIVRTAKNVDTAAIQDNARQMVHSAFGAARNKVARLVSRKRAPAAVYASELLDKRTCRPCERVDGKYYATLEEAEQDYPSGGYTDCKGGHRCRGTLVYVWDEEPPDDQGLIPPTPLGRGPSPYQRIDRGANIAANAILGVAGAGLSVLALPAMIGLGSMTMSLLSRNPRLGLGSTAHGHGPASGWPDMPEAVVPNMLERLDRLQTGTPEWDDLIDEIGDTVTPLIEFGANEALRLTLRDNPDTKFSPGDRIQVEMYDVNRHRYDEFNATWHLYRVDASGHREILDHKLERTFMAHGEAHHDYFSIKDKWQGEGIATAVNLQLDRFYALNGIDRVTVYANIDVGGYTWAVSGFDFDDAYDARRYIGSGSSYSDGLIKQTSTYDWAVHDADLDDLRDRIDNGDDIAAVEIARFGYDPSIHGVGTADERRRMMWPGKEAMLGTSWHGTRYVADINDINDRIAALRGAPVRVGATRIVPPPTPTPAITGPRDTLFTQPEFDRDGPFTPHEESLRPDRGYWDTDMYVHVDGRTVSRRDVNDTMPYALSPDESRVGRGTLGDQYRENEQAWNELADMEADVPAFYEGPLRDWAREMGETAAERPIYIDTSPTYAENLLRSGFFVTDSAHGRLLGGYPHAVDPRFREHDELEHGVFGVPDNVTLIQRPTTGLLGDLHRPPDAADGVFVFRLRPEVRGRTTVTFGDPSGLALSPMPLHHLDEMANGVRVVPTQEIIEASYPATLLPRARRIDPYLPHPDASDMPYAQVHGRVHLSNVDQVHVRTTGITDPQQLHEIHERADEFHRLGYQVIVDGRTMANPFGPPVAPNPVATGGAIALGTDRLRTDGPLTPHEESLHRESGLTSQNETESRIGPDGRTISSPGNDDTMPYPTDTPDTDEMNDPTIWHNFDGNSDAQARVEAAQQGSEPNVRRVMVRANLMREQVEVDAHPIYVGANIPQMRETLRGSGFFESAIQSSYRDDRYPYVFGRSVDSVTFDSIDRGVLGVDLDVVPDAERPVVGLFGTRRDRPDGLTTHYAIAARLRPEVAGRTDVTWGNPVEHPSTPIRLVDVENAAEEDLIRASDARRFVDRLERDQPMADLYDADMPFAHIHGRVHLSNVESFDIQDYDVINPGLRQDLDQIQEELLRLGYPVTRNGVLITPIARPAATITPTITVPNRFGDDRLPESGPLTAHEQDLAHGGMLPDAENHSTIDADGRVWSSPHNDDSMPYRLQGEDPDYIGSSGRIEDLRWEWQRAQNAYRTVATDDPAYWTNTVEPWAREVAAQADQNHPLLLPIEGSMMRDMLTGQGHRDSGYFPTAAQRVGEHGMYPYTIDQWESDDIVALENGIMGIDVDDADLPHLRPTSVLFAQDPSGLPPVRIARDPGAYPIVARLRPEVRGRTSVTFGSPIMSAADPIRLEDDASAYLARHILEATDPRASEDWISAIEQRQPIRSPRSVRTSPYGLVHGRVHLSNVESFTINTTALDRAHVPMYEEIADHLVRLGYPVTYNGTLRAPAALPTPGPQVPVVPASAVTLHPTGMTPVTVPLTRVEQSMAASEGLLPASATASAVSADRGLVQSAPGIPDTMPYSRNPPDTDELPINAQVGAERREERAATIAADGYSVEREPMDYWDTQTTVFHENLTEAVRQRPIWLGRSVEDMQEVLDGSGGAPGWLQADVYQVLGGHNYPLSHRSPTYEFVEGWETAMAGRPGTRGLVTGTTGDMTGNAPAIIADEPNLPFAIRLRDEVVGRSTVTFGDPMEDVAVPVPMATIDQVDFDHLLNAGAASPSVETMVENRDPGLYQLHPHDDASLVPRVQIHGGVHVSNAVSFELTTTHLTDDEKVRAQAIVEQLRRLGHHVVVDGHGGNAHTPPTSVATPAPTPIPAPSPGPARPWAGGLTPEQAAALLGPSTPPAPPAPSRRAARPVSGPTPLPPTAYELRTTPNRVTPATPDTVGQVPTANFAIDPPDPGRISVDDLNDDLRDRVEENEQAWETVEQWASTHRSQAEVAMQRLRDAILAQPARIAMPIQAVDEFIDSGTFLTTHELPGNRGGDTMRDYRAQIEEVALGAPPGEFPAYGFMPGHPYDPDYPDEEYRTRHAAVSGYGDIQVVLRQATMDKRVTITLGDSLDHGLPAFRYRDLPNMPDERLLEYVNAREDDNYYRLMGGNGWPVDYVEVQIHSGLYPEDVSHFVVQADDLATNSRLADLVDHLRALGWTVEEDYESY